MRVRRTVVLVLACAAIAGFGLVRFDSSGQAAGRTAPDCSTLGIDVSGDEPIRLITLPPAQQCTPGVSNGFPVPDPNCTPGAINPTVTIDTLRNPNFRTSCYRNSATSAAQKSHTYAWYNIDHPTHNTGSSQTCELDHVISLELGGADTLDNIWPQCGPDGVTLPERYFKEKDTVENYLAAEVKAGRMELTAAQRGIATDWTQYLHAALEACPGGRCASERRISANAPR